MELSKVRFINKYKPKLYFAFEGQFTFNYHVFKILNFLEFKNKSSNFILELKKSIFADLFFDVKFVLVKWLFKDYKSNNYDFKLSQMFYNDKAHETPRQRKKILE